jgi:hypothetical protein
MTILNMTKVNMAIVNLTIVNMIRVNLTIFITHNYVKKL